MKFIGRVLLLAAYLALLVEAVRTTADWWSGKLAHPGLWDAVFIATLPLLVWVWWRWLSPFGRGRGDCLLPEDEAPGKPRPPRPSGNGEGERKRAPPP